MEIVTKYNLGDIVLAEVRKEYMGARNAQIIYKDWALVECQIYKINVSLRSDTVNPVVTYYVTQTDQVLHYSFSRVEGHLYPSDTDINYFQKVIDMRQKRGKLLKMSKQELVRYIEKYIPKR